MGVGPRGSEEVTDQTSNEAAKRMRRPVPVADGCADASAHGFMHLATGPPLATLVLPHTATYTHCRASEYEGEYNSCKDSLMVLCSTMAAQGAENIPPSQDAVWSKLGSLGGAQYAIELAHRHMRVGGSPHLPLPLPSNACVAAQCPVCTPPTGTQHSGARPPIPAGRPPAVSRPQGPHQSDRGS